MIETNVKVSAELQKELNGKQKLISLIMIMVGIVGLIVYVLLGTFLPGEPKWVELFLIFAIPLGVGIVCYVLGNITNKKSLEGSRELKLIFNEDSYMVIETNNGEKIAEIKVYYNEVIKTKETKNYFFIYKTQTLAHPIKKSDITNEQLEQIKNLINAEKNGK